MRSKFQGKVKNLQKLLDRLRDEANFRISEELYWQTLKDAGEARKKVKGKSKK